MIHFSVVSFLFVSVVNTLPFPEDNFQLSVVHINDFHARFEETNQWGGQCKKNQNCIGGFSRMYHTIMSLKEDNPDALVLNAGDNFQGTVWYSMLKWNVTQYFFNKLPFDAYTLGNHEFDDKVNGAVEFMRHLKAPVVVSNIDNANETELQGLYTKSTVVERNGKKIGIIGVLLTETKEKSKVGNLRFLDESESMNAEAERLVKEQKVFTNIIVSHCGYQLEQEMAKKARGKISLIVGGHTHSLLWDGMNPPSEAEKPEGPYPTVVQRKDGKRVLVVQALSTARYVGNITIFYDANGDVTHWSGKPIFQSSSLPQDENINREMRSWKDGLNEKLNIIIGQTLTDMSSTNCRRKECGLGNLVTDSMVFNEIQYGTNFKTHGPIAMVNCGTLKESIPRGNITYKHLVDALPFSNDIVVGHIRGKYLLEALEHALVYFAEWMSRFVQVSGMQITYDMRKPTGKQLISAKVRCSNCKIPSYVDIVPDQDYNMVIHDFLAQGGDGFTMFRDKFTITRRGDSEVDVLADYIAKKSPVWEEVGGRIKVMGDENIISKYRR